MNKGTSEKTDATDAGNTSALELLLFRISANGRHTKW